MTSGAPLVSIGVPVYNGGGYLAQTLRSIQEQTYSNLEIIISDNASTDETEAVCREAADADSRIRYERHEVNRGGLWNFNRVLYLATGAMVKLAAADDLLRPRFIEACVQALAEAGPQTVLAYPRTQIIDADGEVTEDLCDATLTGQGGSAHERIAEFLRAQAAHLVFGLHRNDVLRTTRGLRPVVGNDLVVLTEMACRGNFVLVPEQLFLQRRHPQQYSAQGVRQVRFHAPGKRNLRFDFPHTKVTLELLRAVSTSPIGRYETLRSALTVLASWTVPRWRGPGSDVRQALLGR